MPDLDELIDWMDALEFYARDWDQTFGEQTNYFTQEFWYMLIGCVRAHWVGHPLTVSHLTQRMKSGSNRTREERIKRAVDDGYLIKVRDDQDGRSSYVRPTPELESMVIGHLTRTLARVSETMQRSKAPQ